MNDLTAEYKAQSQCNYGGLLHGATQENSAYKLLKVRENKKLLKIGTSEEVHILANLLITFRDHE